MSYYPTIEEDLARAKKILAEGVKKPGGHGAIIHAKDIFTAYVLLESFVAEIERLKDLK